MLVAAFVLVHVIRAASAGQRGRAALSRAEAALSAGELSLARQDLVHAGRSFTEARSQIATLGPIAAVARRIPVVGTQLEAVDAFTTAGLDLSQAARPLVDAADSIVNPPDRRLPVSVAIDALRSTQRSLVPAAGAITRASDQVVRLKGDLLIPPLAGVRDDLARRLPRIAARARSADRGLSANLAVVLPPGWRWKGAAPPARLSLDQEIRGAWRLSSRR